MMILCVTPNPAVDRTAFVPGFHTGGIFRPDKLIVAAGGKGLNVARAVNVLGGQSRCAGFLGGHSGRHLAELAEANGLSSAWTWIDGETRSCTIIADPDNEVTVLNENGPTVTDQDWARLGDDIFREAPVMSAICFSGSLPPGISPEAFAKLVENLAAAGHTVWVDTSGAPLKASAGVPGVRIKVNTDEAASVLGRPVQGVQQAADAALEWCRRMRQDVVLTLGGAGAVLANELGRWHAAPPAVKVVNPIASGDSLLAGLVVALAGGKPPDEALRWAVAAGTANAVWVGGAHFPLHIFQQILAETTVQPI